MPVTKKRGAIFAIYADSPVKTPSCAGASAAPGKSAQPSDEAAPREASPSKARTAPPRRALAAIQPSKLQIAISEPPAKGENVQSVKAQKSGKSETRGRGALVEKSSGCPPTSPKPSSTAKSTTSKAVAKRQFEIFTPPSPEAKSSYVSTSPKRSAVAARSAAKAATGSEPPPSPPKRLRSEPSEGRPEKEEEDQDDFKENCPPTASMDSPASRTRSRTAAPAHLHSRPRNPRAPVMRDLQAEDVLREGQPFVGDGRGTLSLKRGRAAASVLDRALPLSDVSRFYGATGIEPEGFRYEGRVAHSTF